MRRLFVINIILGLTVFVLVGCDNTERNTNQAVPNVNVVANSNVRNTNTANVNLPGISTTNSNTTSMDNPVDAKGFMTTAAESGMAEVQLGQLAAKKAQSADVKQFAQKMITDHTKANSELKQLAEKEIVSLPTELNAKHKDLMTKLQGLSGAEFDREYMKAQVEDHEKAVSLFQNQTDDGEDADIKAFASKTLPTLKSHLEMAKSINDKLK